MEQYNTVNWWFRSAGAISTKGRKWSLLFLQKNFGKSPFVFVRAFGSGSYLIYEKAFLPPAPTWELVFPKVFESAGRQLCVSNSVLNVLVTQVVLNRPGIMSVIGQLVACAVPEHVGVY